MTTATALPPFTVLVSLNQKRRMSLLEESLRGACIELTHVQAERDRLRETIRLAAHDIRNGWATAALYALEVAGAGQ